MGTTVSQQVSHGPLPTVENGWYCPVCLTKNSDSNMPICSRCQGEEWDSVKPLPKLSWRCNQCSFNNADNRQSCTACGANKNIPKREKSFITDERVRSNLRPSSVAVKTRRDTDKMNAEKTYKDILAFCQKNNLPFVDDQFPLSSRSLGTGGTDHATKWLTISEIAPSTDTDYGLSWSICNGPEPLDIHQGELGDCWLLAALTLITERPTMLDHILLTKEVNNAGVYLIRICHNGLWKSVLLDGYFPCTKHNKLAYGRAARRQLYVPLIEKACAKLFGSYGCLQGGPTAEGLQLLTGAPCDRINLNSADEAIDFDIIWAKLISSLESKLLIGVSTGRSNISPEEYDRIGLNPNHAFTVLAAKALPLNEERLLLIRDPHGTTNYRDNSIKTSARSYLNSIYEETQDSSGVFWITWAHFLNYFDSITISTYVSSHFDIREVAQFTQSATEPVSAYYFTVPQTSIVIVSLVYHRQSRTAKSAHTQSFVICDVNERTGDVGKNVVIFQSCIGSFIHWNGSLRPGSYVVIPFSTSFWKGSNLLKKNKSIDYTLVIHSSVQLSGTFLKEPAILLTDCLIAATIKYCAKPKRTEQSTMYITSQPIASNIVVVENRTTDQFLTFDMTMTDASNFRHSRYSWKTQDCIPPRHRQLICIVEWIHQENQVSYMSYATRQAFSRGWLNSNPPIATGQDDVHSPRPY